MPQDVILECRTVRKVVAQPLDRASHDIRRHLAAKEGLPDPQGTPTLHLGPVKSEIIRKFRVVEKFEVLQTVQNGFDVAPFSVPEEFLTQLSACMRSAGEDRPGFVQQLFLDFRIGHEPWLASSCSMASMAASCVV